jgi:hypothetical protein
VEPLTAADVAQVLRAAIAAPDAVVLSRPLVSHGTTDVWVQGGRVLLVLGDDCRPVRVLNAVAPDGRRWECGCQRRWLEDGAPVVNPLDEMDVEQLAAALREMPAAELEDEIGWPDFEEVARRQMNVRNASRARGQRSTSREPKQAQRKARAATKAESARAASSRSKRVMA